MAKKDIKNVTIDGNSAASNVAYAFSEVAAIYPITPSSPMGEMADAWAASDKKNIFGTPVDVTEMQSEGGAAGAIHGSLSAGALTTTFTASQGLMLMLPNMFKIAGEMLPTVFHVSARSLAYQSLSIFGDHSDVMAARGTGFGMLASSNQQEAQDIAAIAHIAALNSRVPFLHFFDGFRTSHAIQKVEEVDYDTLKSMIDEKKVEEFRSYALSPERPKVKVGAENPDVYFQGRERANQFYQKAPDHVKRAMAVFAEKTGRVYNLFDYIGSNDAQKVIILMGSAADTAEETVEYLNSKDEKVGVVKVRLYRPFSIDDLKEVLPDTVKKVAVLDRTKESGSLGEPLYLDVSIALKDMDITVIGGRYGLSSKEFTPSMVKAVFDHLDDKCSHDFTVGINDDISNTSIPIKEEIDTEKESVVRCKFWGYGSDGTVGANKSAIKIIGQNTDKFVQGYFQYDSKKSGGITRSHLRFSDESIKSQYLVNNANFIALHKPSYIGKYDILEGIVKGGTFLLNTHHPPEEAFESLTEDMQKKIIENEVEFYVVDASKIANEVGLGHRINTVMQVAFFKIAGVLPVDEAIDLIKKSLKKQFAKKGDEIVNMNIECVDKTLDAVHKVNVPSDMSEVKAFAPEITRISDNASDFAKNVISPIMRLKGDDLPVSSMPIDGSVPLSTSMLEKRGVSENVPKWIPEKCIQCGKCAMVCPHASIRAKQMLPKDKEGAPEGFDTLKSLGKNENDMQFRVQVYPEDCQGCTLCVDACPAKEKALKMVPIEEARSKGENEKQKFFDELPDNVTDGAPPGTIKWSQLKKPLFEFSGACAGCGETPYVKLITQLFGEKMIIANATGCSSIYGGTFPTVPYCVNKAGKGPAWANSLFEDNAEYGFGMKLAVDANRKQLKYNINKLLEAGADDKITEALKKLLELWDSKEEDAVKAVEDVKTALPEALEKAEDENEQYLKKIDELKDYLSPKSVWIFGGDGWAYDIGYGGLDHVLAQGKDVNVLVVDTEVYSNTGGQSSKATPFGATAKFASSGKRSGKKNLGLMMITYGNVYVASVSMGANQMQLLKAVREAEAYNGPSIIIAYAPCIAHGINMENSQKEEKLAVDAGYWPLYRYNPDLAKQGKNPLTWETPDPKMSFKDFLMGENRYRALHKQNPEVADKLFKFAEDDAKRRFSNIKEYVGETKKE